MAESNPYTYSTIRCLKCVSFVLYEFPKIMQKIMEKSGLSSAWVFNRIQNDLEFDSKLTGPEKQTTHTLQSYGYKYLDVTLIYKIITHFKVFLPTPTRGWGSRPKPNETRIGDDVERLRLKRNQFMHKGTDVLSEVEFEAFFTELTSLCERVDRYVSCPDEESFMRKAKNYKIQPLRDPEEIRQEYNKERSLTEFFVSQTGKNRFKIYKTQSFKAFVQHILENQEHDGVNTVPITLTFDEIQSNSEFIRIMNELREEINKNLVHIEVKKIENGCLIMDITVTLFVLLSDDDFERELKLMLDYLSSCHFFGEVLSKVSTVTIVISEYEETPKAKSSGKTKTRYLIKPTQTSMTLEWSSFVTEEEIQFYQIKCRPTTEKLFRTIESLSEKVEIADLKADTEYEVKVFWVNEDGDNHVVFQDRSRTLSSETKHDQNQTELGQIPKLNYVITPSSTTLAIKWDDTEERQYFDCYQIKYRSCETEKGFQSVQSSTDKVEITCLRPSTTYEVRLFWVDYDGENHQMFTAKVTTKESKSEFLKGCNMYYVEKATKPYVYHFKPVHIQRVPDKTKDNFNLRICEIVSHYEIKYDSHDEKTILMLGATGTGKSTLIEALINYITEVSYSEDHRFSLINKTEEKKAREENTTESQTSSITVYRIPKLEGLRLDHRVNIIDTPGFNDTRKDFDKRITAQLANLFEQEILTHVNAIFIVLPMSVNRLTAGQTHVFTSIFEIFGKDVEQNVFIAFTHDDGGSIKGCLKVIDQAGIKYNTDNSYFRFNNSNVLAPFPDSERDREADLWELRNKSFTEVFEVLAKIPKTNLKSSIEEMHNRTRLELQLSGLQQDIQNITGNAIRIQKVRNQIDCHAKTAELNDNYFITEEHVRYEQLYTGKNSINCPKHERTCHADCWVPLDFFIGKCEIFKNGICAICDCNTRVHSRGPYRYKQKIEEREVTKTEMQKAYLDARVNLSESRSLSSTLETQFNTSVQELESKLKQMNDILKLLMASAMLPPKPDEIVRRMGLIIDEKKLEGKENTFLRKCLEFYEKGIPLPSVVLQLLEL